jgi:hypothetical protein
MLTTIVMVTVIVTTPFTEMVPFTEMPHDSSLPRLPGVDPRDPVALRSLHVSPAAWPTRQLGSRPSSRDRPRAVLSLEPVPVPRRGHAGEPAERRPPRPALPRWQQRSGQRRCVVSAMQQRSRGWPMTTKRAPLATEGRGRKISAFCRSRGTLAPRAPSAHVSGPIAPGSSFCREGAAGAGHVDGRHRRLRGAS